MLFKAKTLTRLTATASLLISLTSFAYGAELAPRRSIYSCIVNYLSSPAPVSIANDAITSEDVADFDQFLGERESTTGQTYGQIAQSTETDAIQTLHDIVLTPKAAERAVRDWFNQIKARPIGVMEHVTLTHILRSGFLDGDTDPTIRNEMSQVLEKSWLRLTGKPSDIDAILNTPLPKRVMKDASHDARLFQKRMLELPAKAISDANFLEVEAHSHAHLSQGVARNSAQALTLAAASLAITSHLAGDIPGGYALAGGTIGILATSNLEVLLHRFMMHASPAMMKRYKNWGALGRVLEQTRHNHLEMHHGLFPASRYTVDRSDWGSAEPILDKNGNATSMRKLEKQDSFLEKHGHPEGEGHRNQYGLTLDNAGLAQVLSLTLPVSSAISYTLFGFDHFTGWAALMAGTHYGLYGVRTMHTFLHTKPEMLPSAMRMLLKFPWFRNYFALVSRLHFQHHMNVKKNFYLFVPFGKSLEPDLKGVLKMWSQDVLR